MHETSLKAEHEALGAKLIDFAGWNMPVWYSSSVDEHNAVRERVGLFDLGHMGRLDVKGAGAQAGLDALVPTDVPGLEDGQAKYSFFLTPEGTYIDDILIYVRKNTAEDADYFVVVNASNREKVLAHLAEHFTGGEVIDRTAELAMIAVQGPKALELVDGLCGDVKPSSLAYYTWAPFTMLDTPVEIARTGYTGEDGVEIYVAADKAPHFWKQLLDHGADHGVLPCGLSARDSLRLEAAMALYGHEIDDTTNPVEARASWAVAWDKEADYIGKAAIAQVKADGPTRRLVGLVVDTKRVPRQGAKLFSGDEEVGFVTSGAMSPSRDGERIAMGYVRKGLTKSGTELELDLRGKRAPAKVVKLPFHKRAK